MQVGARCTAVTQLMKCKRHAGVYPHEDISSTPIAYKCILLWLTLAKLGTICIYFYPLIKLTSSAGVEGRRISIYNTIQYDLA
jgi:hypothetical protein